MEKQQISRVIDTSLIFIWGLFLLTFPLLFTTLTTDVFVLPKEILLTTVVLLSLILLAVKMILTEKVTLRRTPFDLPVAILLIAFLLSSIFAVNRADSLIAVAPVILAGLGYFLFVHVVKKENTAIFMLTSLSVGAGAAALLAIFSYFKVYPLFFAFTHVPAFTLLGSLIEQAFYFALLLPVTLVLASPLLKGKTNNKTVTFGSLSIVLLAGLLITLLQLFTTQKPTLLPFETGFQTAFAAISQDTGRIAQGFALGSGYGNYATVFTRFKQVTFNANPTLWTVQFNNSSSFVLEILATTGVLGFLAFLFLLFRVVTKPAVKKTNPAYLGLVVLSVLSFILPFSFIEVSLLFILLGIFAVFQSLKSHKEYYDVELKFVALKKGIISLQQIEVPSHEKYEYNRPTAFAIAGICIIFVALFGWYAVRFVLSDMTFQKSLVLAAGNNGSATYQAQVKAISTFPYRSAYYSIFSQTNIALAGSLANLKQPKGAANTQTQSTLYTLIQQGITTGRQATTLSPLTVTNWQNLSSIYRALIGLGQNADTFAIQAAQQAVVLDPNNPQEYIALGGIYYQLSQWDNAIRAFQQAAALKQDYSNAYYNLGHAYEQKGDYQDALTAYQAVKTLVGNDQINLAKINSDITNVQGKLGGQNAPTPTPTPKIKANPTIAPQPLNLSGEQNGPAKPTTTPEQPAAPSPAQ